MLRVAIKGALARKFRLLLTSIAVVLGVGFVAGAFFLTDSIRSSFDTLFTEAAQGIDVQVQTKEYKELAKKQVSSGAAAVPIDVSKVGVPADAIDRIRDVPGVRDAQGVIFEGGALPLDKHGKPVQTGGAPSFAANWIAEAEDVGALRITKGKAPHADEVLLDATTMDRAGYEVGDRVRLLIQSGRSTKTFRISGVASFGSSNSLNGASITVFETATVQRLLDLGGRFTSAQVQADGSTTPSALKLRVAQAVGTDYDVITGDEFTKEQTDAIDTGFLNILQNVILGFAAVAVFVGAFTIFNTFTILVGQRTREFGLLRAIGAGRKQVLGIVALEALILGIIASTLGIAAGYGLATVLRALINHASDSSISTGAFPLHTRTVVASYLVGVIVTLVASVVPAWRASRLSPLEALRSNPAHAGRGWKTPAVGVVLCLIGGALVVSGFTAGDDASTSSILSRIGGGFGLAIIGIALLSRLFILPVTRVLGLALGRGTSGGLATRNVLRNRARSATTASALMIGLALASLVLVFYASLQRTVEHQIDDVLGSDITIYNTTLQSTGVGTVEQRTVDRITDVDGVDAIASQRMGGTVIGRRFDTSKDVQTIAALDAAAIGSGGAVELDPKHGSVDPGDGVLVDADLAKERHLGVGDDLQLAFSGGQHHRFRVRGVFEPNQVIGAPLLVSEASFDRLQPPALRAPAVVYVTAVDGVAPRTLANRIERDLGKDASFLEIQDGEAFRKQFNDQLAPVLGLVLGMLSLSLVIALFGIGNTLALNVFERTREIGLLRAVGGTRGQTRWMICVEAVLVALFGAIVGVLVGVGAGRALVQALHDDGFVFASNWPALLLVLLAGLVAGLLASLLPARRAARTDVLAAIATE